MERKPRSYYTRAFIRVVEYVVCSLLLLLLLLLLLCPLITPFGAQYCNKRVNTRAYVYLFIAGGGVRAVGGAGRRGGEGCCV
jgi:hypothetical protein